MNFKRVLTGLQFKLTISFILLIVLIAGMTFLYTFRETKKALLESTREDLFQMVGIVTSQFTPEDVAVMTNLQAGDESSPAYLALKHKMQQLRSMSPLLINLYTMKVDGSTVTFYIDDLDEGAATIGQQYEEPEDRLFEAENGISVSDNVYTDEWGTFLSGYAPMKDAEGKTVALLGADISAKQVIDRQNFIGNTIYYVIGFSVLIAGVMIALFSLTIIRDINKLNTTAEKISMGDMNVTVDVKRSDEIGRLADSFSRMVTSLKIMMSSNDVTPQS